MGCTPAKPLRFTSRTPSSLQPAANVNRKPARFAGESYDRTTVDPGALETCGVKQSPETSYLKRNRAQRIPSWLGERDLQQRPNTFARTNLPASLFACRRAADHTFTPPSTQIAALARLASELGHGTYPEARIYRAIKWARQQKFDARSGCQEHGVRDW